MRRSRDLAKLAAQVSYRVDRLLGIASNTLAKTDAEAYRAVSYLAIEAQTAWSAFAREYFLSCAYLRPRAVGGALITHSVVGVTDELSAISQAIMFVKDPAFSIPSSGKIDPRLEPDWKRKDVILRLGTQFGLSNQNEILQALSYPTSFFDDLPTLRNFFAHRDAGTAAKVRNLAYRKYKLSQIPNPAYLINDVLPYKSDTLIREWLSDIRTIANGLCL